MGYDLGDFEAHVTGFSEYAASSGIMGFGGRCVGVLVYKLRRARDGVEIDDHEQRRRTTNFEPIPLEFHLYSTSSIDTAPLLKKR